MVEGVASTDDGAGFEGCCMDSVEGGIMLPCWLHTDMCTCMWCRDGRSRGSRRSLHSTAALRQADRQPVHMQPSSKSETVMAKSVSFRGTL